MARRIHTDEETADTQPTPAAAAEPNLEGGALGVPDAANNVGGADVAMSNRVFAPSMAKRYSVMQTKRVNLAGGITFLHAGQTIDENNYDIAGLKRAGVELQPIVEPVAE